MNRWLVGILAIMLSWYANTNVVCAQVVFKGPTEGKAGKMNVVTLDQVKGDDLKLQVFVDGKMADATDWMLMRNIDNQFVIFILTDKQGVFTLVGAVNSEKKTLLSNHIITIGKPKPTPVDPVDPVDPERPTFGTKIKGAYKVSPDSASLSKLIAILEEVNGKSYNSFDEMETVLAATGKKFLPNDELRKVRDIITDEIIAKAGTDARRRDVEKVKAVYTEAITILKGL